MHPRLSHLLACALVCVPLACSAAFPDRPITLVVPFGAGGTTDVIARTVAEQMGKDLKQPIAVDNRAGAGGNIGAGIVAKAKPDGYTLFLGYNGTNAINPHLYKSLPFDPKTSFAPIGMVARVSNALVVRHDLPAANLQQLNDLAKKEQGKLTYGTAGLGSILHLAAELYASHYGVRLTHVPYKTSPAIFADLVPGRIDMAFPTVLVSVPYVRDGRLRALAVTGAKRSELLPNAPSFGELGIPPADSWFALFAPAGTDTAIVNQLAASLERALTSAPVRHKFAEIGTDVETSTPAQLKAILENDMKTWGEIVRKLGLTIE